MHDDAEIRLAVLVGGGVGRQLDHGSFQAAVAGVIVGRNLDQGPLPFVHVAAVGGVELRLNDQVFPRRDDFQDRFARLDDTADGVVAKVLHYSVDGAFDFGPGPLFRDPGQKLIQAGDFLFGLSQFLPGFAAETDFPFLQPLLRFLGRRPGLGQRRLEAFHFAVETFDLGFKFKVLYLRGQALVQQGFRQLQPFGGQFVIALRRLLPGAQFLDFQHALFHLLLQDPQRRIQFPFAGLEGLALGRNQGRLTVSGVLWKGQLAALRFGDQTGADQELAVQAHPQFFQVGAR